MPAMAWIPAEGCLCLAQIALSTLQCVLTQSPAHEGVTFFSQNLANFAKFFAYKYSFRPDCMTATMIDWRIACRLYCDFNHVTAGICITVPYHDGQGLTWAWFTQWPASPCDSLVLPSGQVWPRHDDTGSSPLRTWCWWIHQSNGARSSRPCQMQALRGSTYFHHPEREQADLSCLVHEVQAKSGSWNHQV